MNTLTFTRFLLVIVAWTATASLRAQTIKVTDKEGRGIPFALVLNTKGNLIGTTNLLGILADVMGINDVLVTHVAYKPQQVTVSSLEDGRIKMEDADYSLPESESEITETSHFYAETYYRAYAFQNGVLRYFTAGIMPIDFDLKEKVKLGNFRDCSGEFHSESLDEDNLKGFLSAHYSPFPLILPMVVEDKEALDNLPLTVKDIDNGQKAVITSRGFVGKITRSGIQSRLSISLMAMLKACFQDMGQSYLVPALSKLLFDLQQTTVSDNEIEGETVPDDLKMFSTNFIWKDKQGKFFFVVETHVVERSYTNKKEIKAKKKQLTNLYKAPMYLDELEAYAAEHHIPALAPILRQAIEKRLRNY